MTISIALLAVLLAVFYFIVPFLVLWLIKNEKVKKIVSIILFCVYVIVLLLGSYSKLEPSSHFVKFSFDFTGKWCDGYIKTTFVGIPWDMVLINLVLLVPVGIFMMYFIKDMKPLTKILLLLGFGLLAGVFLELLQFILPIPRAAQLSVMLFKMMGVYLGGMIAQFYFLIIEKINEKQRERELKKW